jgi:hypothetical protein
MTQGAVLNARYIYLFFSTKGGLLKGDSNVVVKVSTVLRCLTARSSRSPSKKGVKDITEATEIKPVKAPLKGPFVTAVPEAVVSGTFIRVREHFKGLV